MKNIIVADVMTRDPITEKPETNLLECSKKMVKKKIGSLLLTKDKHLVGIITGDDVLWAIAKRPQKELKNIPAIDISPKKIATIRPVASVKEALLKMKKFKFERLPVIDKGELVGMVTVRDILNFSPEIYPELEEFAEIREETEKIKRMKNLKQKSVVDQGVCEECGNLDRLYRSGGILLCENCISSQ